MRSKAFLAVMVALAMLISFGAAAKDAKADAILFPWIVKSNSVSTIVSVVNTAGVSLDYDGLLHYQYWYKRTTANGQTEVCDPVSFKRPTSKDDIVTFDAAGNINGGKALFNDPSPYGGNTFMLNAEAPRRAFLIVDNNTPAFVREGVNVDGTLYGEAMVLELSGGAAWGYIAYNAAGGQASSQSTQVIFDDGNDMLGEVIGSTEHTLTTLMPPDVITTRFFMTPVGPRTTTATDTTVVGQRIGNANTRIQLMVMDPVTGFDGRYGGIYDNDENIIDFDRKKNIVCTSADDLRSLMTEASYNTFKDTGGQGWAYIWTLSGTVDQAPINNIADNPTSAMIMGKLEFTTAGVTIDGKNVLGTLNNFVWLKNSATVSDYAGINNIYNVTPWTIGIATVD